MSTARVLYFTEPRGVRIREQPLGSPGPSELLIESECSAISPGTEGLVYRGEAPEGMARDPSIGSLQGDLEFPLAYGYALVGRVLEHGAEVPEEWAERRVFAFHPHATRALVTAEDAMPVPAEISSEAAALYPTLETAVGLVQDARPLLGERVLVTGQGVVGLSVTSLLARFPLDRLVTADRYANRRERSRALGADASVDPDGGSEALREAIGASEDGVDGYDLVLECSGAPEALDAAVSVAGYAGRIVVGSWYGRKRADLDLGGRFHRARIRIVSSQVSTVDPRLRGRWTRRRRGRTAWRMLQELDAADRFVTHRIPFEESARAYRLLEEEPDRALQVVLRYTD